MSESTHLVTQQQAQAISLSTAEGFEHAQRVAQIYAKSQLVPTAFQNNIPNVVIAMEIASRIGASALAVMQSLDIIHGRPSWRAQFIIAAVNSCGRFHPLRYEVTGKGDSLECIAWSMEKDVAMPNNVRTLEAARAAKLPVLESAPVSLQMAKDEGWYGKTGSKWKTMPELMIRYRASTFFGRMYAPDILMGMQSEDEVIDVRSLPAAEPALTATSGAPASDDSTVEAAARKRRAPRGGVAAAAAEAQPPLKDVTPPENPAPPKEEPKPAETPAPAPVETPVAPAEQPQEEPDPAAAISAPAGEVKRCEIKNITPKKSTAGPTLEVELTGEYAGKAYFLGTADKFPAVVGVVADLTIEKKLSGDKPFYFINAVNVLA